MYYVEKMINGFLVCRRRPDGEWVDVPTSRLHARIVELEEENKKLLEGVIQ